ncbi:acyl-CoA thioesterase domain-containing protein [Nocardia asiatica]|uniref:acyl-CoA thioesterase domain-containing protein n=1 Tax=Nocardia asiatica TaxID=209252 RepID=UPI002453E4D0|nr:acyl-CoA thioesterase domain-containing protein [Nocardia asiatica]
MIGFFTRHRDGVVAEPIARSVWNSDHLGGPPVSGLLARELDTCCPDGFVPARLTVDLFRPVLDRPITIRSETVRRGRRITVADAAIVQNDQVRARATALFLSPGAVPPGQLWSAGDELPGRRRREPCRSVTCHCSAAAPAAGIAMAPTIRTTTARSAGWRSYCRWWPESR